MFFTVLQCPCGCLSTLSCSWLGQTSLTMRLEYRCNHRIGSLLVNDECVYMYKK